MIENAEKLIEDFIRVAQIASYDMTTHGIQHESKPSPHTPSSLPKGKQAVYVFSIQTPVSMVLKVGKAGPKSKARFSSHHYNPRSAKSNLAKSLLHDELFWHEARIESPDEDHIGEWIKQNTDRENFYLDVKVSELVLTLMESFFQCRLKPRYEGRGN